MADAVSGPTPTVGVARSIIIGAGGTGQQILLEIRKRLVDKYGSLSRIPIVRFLGIDTTESLLADNVGYQKEVNLQPSEELYAQVQDIWKYRKDLDRHPQLNTWVDPSILSSNVYLGAGAVRSRGRLAFVVNYPAIRDAMFERLSDVTSREARQQASANNIEVREGVITVYIVCSLLGGTGSGMFLDLAYVAKNELRRAAGANDIQTIGIFVLPPAGGVGVDTCSANAYSSLLELNYFSDPTTEFVAQYEPNMSEIRDYDSPFSYCYLLDCRNETGEVIEQKNLVEMIAHYVFLDLTHEFSQKKNDNRDDVRAQLGQDEYDCPTGYLSFGLSAIVFPKDQVLHVCANRLSKDLVSAWMEPVNLPDSKELASEASERVAHAGWERGTVVAGLNSEGLEQHGRPAQEAANALVRRAEQTAKGQSGDAVARTLERLVQEELPRWISAGDEAEPDVLRRRNLGRFPEAIQQGLTTRIARARAWFDELVPALVNDRRYRQRGAMEILRHVTELLHDYQDGLMRECAGEKAQTETLLKDISAKLTNVRNTVRAAEAAPPKPAEPEPQKRKKRKGAEPQPPPPKGPDPESAISSFCRTAASYAQSRVVAFVADCAIKLYDELLAHLRDLQAELGEYERRVAELCKTFGQEETRFLESMPAVNGEIIYHARVDSPRAAIDSYYRQLDAPRIQRLDEEIQQTLGIADMGLYAYFMTQYSLDTLQEQIRDAAMAVFREPLEQVHVLDLFYERYGEETRAESKLEQVYGLSAPFVHARSGGVPGYVEQDKMRQFALGCPNALSPQTGTERRFRAMADKLLPAIRADSWVHVAGKSEVLMLRERGGFPLRLMEDALSRCRDYYVKMTHGRREPIHSREDIADWGSLIPPSPETRVEAWETFVRAVSAGVVERSEQHVETPRGTRTLSRYQLHLYDEDGIRDDPILGEGMLSFGELEFSGRPYPAGVSQLLLRLCDPQGLSDLAHQLRRELSKLESRGVKDLCVKLLKFVNEEIPQESEFAENAKDIVRRYLAELNDRAGEEEEEETGPDGKPRPKEQERCSCGKEPIDREEFDLCPTCGRYWACPQCGKPVKPHWVKCGRKGCHADLTPQSVEEIPADQDRHACPDCEETFDPHEMDLCPGCGRSVGNRE